MNKYILSGGIKLTPKMLSNVVMMAELRENLPDFDVDLSGSEPVLLTEPANEYKIWRYNLLAKQIVAAHFPEAIPEP